MCVRDEMVFVVPRISFNHNNYTLVLAPAPSLSLVLSFRPIPLKFPYSLSHSIFIWHDCDASFWLSWWLCVCFRLVCVVAVCILLQYSVSEVIHLGGATAGTPFCLGWHHYRWGMPPVPHHVHLTHWPHESNMNLKEIDRGKNFEFMPTVIIH